MQDLKLRSLVDEVNRCTSILNEADEEASTIAIYELSAAKERLNLYLKERRINHVG